MGRDAARDVGGPEDGHTFRIAVTSRGSYAVVGEPHEDANYWGPGVHTLDVRAWSLSEAMRKASEVALPDWGYREPSGAVFMAPLREQGRARRAWERLAWRWRRRRWVDVGYVDET